ncbi:hypothetical protein KI387_037086, partial [Taxus chinensis]
NKKKLDMKSQKLIFVGYNEEALRYRLMDMKTKKFYTSRDVELFEKKEAETPPPDSLGVDISPVVKVEADVATDDDCDDEDGDD